MRATWLTVIGVTAISAIFTCTSTLQADNPAAIEFQRDVRPILSSMCFQCHGPDEEDREADLRFDTQAGLASGAIVAGDPEASELIARVTSDDDDLRMPPADTGKRLSRDQIEMLRQWIKQGATSNRHWAFVPPRIHAIPSPDTYGQRMANPIDAFVAARLQQTGLRPAPAAEPATIVRRLYLDLIGLPPTIEQADRFIQNPDPTRYAELVEELLASPHYGEKWARHWLDAARYADSDGFEKDKPRQVWMYRDWVVQALNQDLPYDQFIIQQIAGDLLPNATQDQIVATGFVRQSMLNEEGGIDPEQFRMEAMFDRMDAVGKAVLGITLQWRNATATNTIHLHKPNTIACSRFLNNSHEGSVPVYRAEQLAERNQVLSKICAIERRLQETPDWKQQMQQWIESVRGKQPDWRVLELVNANDNAQRYLRQGDDSLLAQGYAPTRFDAQFTASSDVPEMQALKLELLTDPNLPAGGPGRSPDGLCALTELRLEVSNRQDEQQKRAVEFERVTADYSNRAATVGSRVWRQGRQARIHRSDRICDRRRQRHGLGHRCRSWPAQCFSEGGVCSQGEFRLRRGNDTARASGTDARRLEQRR